MDKIKDFLSYKLLPSYLHLSVVLPPLEGARERFLSLFRPYIPPLLGRSLRIGEYVNGVRILFLSPRNLVFTIFNPVISHYESTFYTPFLYQSFIIRSSFLYPFYILTPPILHPFFTKTSLSSLPFFSVSFRIPQPLL